VFIEVFRALASRQRMFGEMQLAEGVSAQSTTSMFVYQALGNRARSVSTNRYAISSRFRARAPLSIEEITTLAAPSRGPAASLWLRAGARSRDGC
jgi:hypothetical protein